MHHVPVPIAKHLHLNMPRVRDVLLQINIGAAEGRFGLGLGLLQAVFQRQLVDGHAHPATAPARRRLDQHRKTDFAGKLQGVRLAFDQSLAARHRGHAGLLCDAAGRVLVADQRHCLVRRADELDITAPAYVGEIGVL